MEQEEFLPIVTVAAALKDMLISDVIIEYFNYTSYGNIYFRYTADEADVVRGYISIRDLNVIANDDIDIKKLSCLASCSINGQLVIYSAEMTVGFFFTRLKHYMPKELLRKG